MAIIYNGEEKTISLHTAHTTYQMLIGKYQYLLHLYYGHRAGGSMEYLLNYRDRGFSGNPYDAGNDRTFSLDTLPQEYPVYGDGDYRTAALVLEDENGIYGCDLRVVSHSIHAGKYTIPGLPAAYGQQDDVDTLEVILEDPNVGVRVTLRYGVFEKEDVITRCACIENTGTKRLILHKENSAMLDIHTGEFDLLHFHGRHGMERNMERTSVSHQVQSIGSLRGTSSHQQNPFCILAARDATETQGDCYGMMLLYSGNFKATVEKDQTGMIRAGIGLQEELFAWELKPGECFDTPEAALSYTGEGLGKLSRQYHELIRYHVCRGAYRDKRRPVLINNWEATEFDFTGDKIIQIARQASELGVEMMVLDDGWFGERNSDRAGLGDWIVNETKTGGPLARIADAVHEMGMKFGLWIEPEMVNEDSALFREHPDWAFRIPGRNPVRGRYQLVLDFSRPEVVNAVFDQIVQVLDATRVEYIKMDMNRSLSDIYSAKYRTDRNRQNAGRIMHEYVLGVYDFLDRLLTRYPNLLIEGCSGGGGRYDAGMMYYTPQIWLSDDTDAIERLHIQYGSSFGYPVSTVGSHVTAVPNQQTGRKESIHTRAVVAMAGSFGYELDLNLIEEEEKEEVRRQIRDYIKYWPLIHNGIYYRLTNPEENKEAAAWDFVSKDQSECLLNIVSLNAHCNGPDVYICCRGLDPEAFYEEETTGQRYSGAALMYAGVQMPVAEEYTAWQMHFLRVGKSEETD